VRFWKGLLFLGYWTGLRIGDLRCLEWSCVLPDRIEWIAAKTGVRHVFPVTDEVQRHLDIVRGLSRKYVLPIPQGSLRYVRKELKRLCKIAGVEPFGPQMVRRASITEWACTTEDAGALIHGSGLGVRKHYVSPLKVLTRAAERFELPDSMCAVPTVLPSNGEQTADPDADVTEELAALSPSELAMLMRLAKALTPKPTGESSCQPARHDRLSTHCDSP
jgi:hypothetical protein